MKLKKQIFYRIIKKFEDIIFSISTLIIFLPIIIIVIILSFFIQGRPIFYISKRIVGLQKKIHIIKFRTMIKDAKDPKWGLEEKYMRDGYLDVPIYSEVYTPFGRLLEKTQLVEILQVFHVLLNRMSFVGNRPLPEKNVELLKKKFPDTWQERFKSPAGMTGITQVAGKFNLTSKQRLELESLYSKVYQKGNVLKADAYIFFSTIILLLLKDASAYRSYDSAKNVLTACLKK
ncbi:MAG: sugar transferase [Candidatus Marinimicrobia bacterium]|nr:sugar transferase [Candidatus Neomarinimicrobiota bacterium]